MAYLLGYVTQYLGIIVLLKSFIALYNEKRALWAGFYSLPVGVYDTINVVYSMMRGLNGLI